MGYYHIELSPDSKWLCTIVLPWGKYEYQKLPMGLCNSPDIFQEKMSAFFGDLKFIRTYIDDLLVLTKSDWQDHVHHLDIIFHCLQQAGLKVNTRKSFFGRKELEYLGYWISCAGIQPIAKKVAAIKNIALSTSKREQRSFIGIVSYIIVTCGSNVQTFLLL
jgi:Reverse transcriptase (RNA-dependent DNA polymerase)